MVFQISLQGYTIGNRLGGGGTSEVYAAVRNSDRLSVAVKILNHVLPPPQWGHPDRLRMQIGMTIWSHMEHPNIVRVIDCGILSQESRPCLVLEYMPGGSLRRRMWQGIRLSDAIRTLADIASALDYLHLRNVCHSDVKAENILFSVNGQGKLNDLDRSTYVPRGESAWNRSVWPLYGTNYGWPDSEIGPELQNESIPDLLGYYELDWLQFCIMAYEVLTGRVLPREFVPPHRINRHVPLSLSELIYRNISPQGARHRNLYDMASKLKAAEQELEADVLLRYDWEHYLTQNLRLDVFPIGLPYSSVGPGGNVYSAELGFIHHVDERKVKSHFIDINLLGCAAFSNGQFQRASEYFQEAARERDHSSIVHYNMAVTLMKLGKQREAVSYLRGIQREGNKSLEVRCALMVALSAVDPVAAYELARELVGVRTPRAYGQIGEPWLDESKLERGMGTYSCELAAVVCFRAGDYELARGLLSRVQRLGSLT